MSEFYYYDDENNYDCTKKNFEKNNFGFGPNFFCNDNDLVYWFKAKCRASLGECGNKIDSNSECIISSDLLENYENDRRRLGQKTNGDFITIVFCLDCRNVVPINDYNERYLKNKYTDYANQCQICGNKFYKFYIVV